MDWQPIETAPKTGVRIYVAGFWDETKGAAKHCHGEPHTCIGAWSTWMSDGSGHQWIYEGALGNHTSEAIAVTFTNWMSLPRPPVSHTKSVPDDAKTPQT